MGDSQVHDEVVDEEVLIQKYEDDDEGREETDESYFSMFEILIHPVPSQ